MVHRRKEGTFTLGLEAHEKGAMPVILIKIIVIFEFYMVSYVYESFIARRFFYLIAESTKNFEYLLRLFTIKCKGHFLLFLVSKLDPKSAIRR